MLKYIITIMILINFTVFGNTDFFDDTKIKDPELQKGIEYYQSLEFEKAVKIFNSIIKKTNDRFIKATCYKYLAFTYTLKQDEEKTEENYSKLFEIYPDFDLDYTTVTPKISDYFKDYHEIWLRTPGVKAKVYLINKKEVTYDSGVKLEVEWHDPNLEIGRVKIKYKKENDKKYSELVVNEVKVNNNYTAVFNLSFLNDPMLDFVLNYYIEIYDTEDKLLYKIKDKNNPASLKVKVPGGRIGNVGETKEEWYQSNWFIGGVAVITLAAIGAGAYYYYINSGEGEPDEAQLYIYITNGN